MRPPIPRSLAALAASAALLLAAAPARADLHIGVILSLTGPAASLGIPAENSVKLWPAEIGGQKVTVTVLNDNSDPTTAAKNATKLITEDSVDVIVGPSVTPTSLTVVEVAAQNKVPMISLAGGGAIVLPQDGPRRWAFKLSPTEPISVNMVLDHLLANKGKTLATIGLANSYGEGFLKATQTAAAAKGITIVASEKYGQADSSVTAQMLKIASANPDAVYIFSAGTPGALPQIELATRGYKGLVYQTQGVANADFLRVGGKSLDGAYMTVAPVLVAEQLPDSNASKKAAMAYVKMYEDKYGSGTRSLFGATAWSAMTLLNLAVPMAAKVAKPGTPEFRSALRDALEGLKETVTPEAVLNMSATDHNGVDARSQVMVKIDAGQWKLVK